MGLEAEEIESIIHLREISALFCNNEISMIDFFDKFKFSPSFDYGVEFTRDDLPDTFSNEIKDEIMFYFKFTTYNSDDIHCVVPTNPKWKYGVSNEPYGWIDEEAYRKVYKGNFQRLCLETLK